MTRIAINPGEARAAGLAAIAGADDVVATGAAIAGFAVPSMPAELAAKYPAALEGAAARARQIAAELARIGEELQVRASAAELADGGSAGGGLAGRRLALALGATTVVGMGGAVVAVSASARHGRLVATTGSGTTLVIGTRDHEQRPRPTAPPDRGTEPADEADGDGEHQPTAEANPPPPTSPDLAEPVGGSASAHAQEATATAEAPPSAAIGVAAGEVPADIGQGGELRAVDAGVQLADSIAATEPPPDSVDRQSWACWMAGRAAQEGVPPTLPLMESLATSGLRNMPETGERVGLFGLDPRTSYAPAGHGMPRDAHASAEWWQANPSAQLENALRRFKTAGGGDRDGNLEDPDALSRWIADSGGTMSSEEYAAAHESASALVESCAGVAGEGAAGPVSGGGTISVAASQLGVSEAGTNSGPEVDAYLAAAGAGSGNPWCAGFVTWVLEQNGHEMSGEGWAAVATWVAAAGAGEHGLSVVDAAEARPGDIVAFDWGGGGDYGADGHIGFLSSEVSGDSFETIEGNSGDAVSSQQRSLSQGSPVFIRVGG